MGGTSGIGRAGRDGDDEADVGSPRGSFDAGDDPVAAALGYFDGHLAGLSASSLRHAVGSARAGHAKRIADKLAEVEELYLSGLMRTRDAVEGLEAFIEKRPAKWERR